MPQRTARRARRGFTMIELIAVVAVIALLAGLAQMNFAATKADAYQLAMENDARNFPQAQERHFDRYGQYMSIASTDTVQSTDTSIGYFRLSEDVGMSLESLTEDGYSFLFAHRKLKRTRCLLVYKRSQATRVTCETNPSFDNSGYDYQND